MRNRNQNQGGLEPNWWYVLAALVVGLIIPDNMNPVGMLLGKFNSKKEEEKK